MASRHRFRGFRGGFRDDERKSFLAGTWRRGGDGEVLGDGEAGPGGRERGPAGRGARGGARRPGGAVRDRKSTRLNSSHQIISYAVFCLKKKKKKNDKYIHTSK